MGGTLTRARCCAAASHSALAACTHIWVGACSRTVVMVAVTSPPGGKTLWLMLMQPCGLVLPVSAESCCTAALAAAKLCT